MSETPLPPQDCARQAAARPTNSRPGRGVRGLLVAALVLPMAACATKADVRDLQTELRQLTAQQEALIRELQQEQRVQRDSLRAVSAQVGETRVQLVRTLRDMEDQLIRIAEFQGLSQQQLAALRDQMDRRPALPMGGFDPDGPESGGAAQDIYDDAMTQFRRGSISAARFGFEEVVERFPTHELTPSARYYLADILVQEDRLEEAIRAFETIPQYHPDAPRVPEALFRIGLLHRELGDTAEARRHFERVVNTWPESSAADLARNALREMG